LIRFIETDYPDETRTTKTYDFRNDVVKETDQAGNFIEAKRRRGRVIFPISKKTLNRSPGETGNPSGAKARVDFAAFTA
jgi:hypothetical protein